tara:strand:+ start:184 stop:804 length:621 start_codon:yes stop_codon:yes gene_type:complete
MTTKVNSDFVHVSLCVGLTKAFLEGKQAVAKLDTAKEKLVDAKTEVKDKQKQFNAKVKELRKSKVDVGNAGYAKGGIHSRQTVDKPRACSNANAIAQTLYDAVDADGNPLYTPLTVNTYLKLIRDCVNNGTEFSFNPARESGNTTDTTYMNIRFDASLDKASIVESVMKSINKSKEKAHPEKHACALAALSFLADGLTNYENDKEA